MARQHKEDLPAPKVLLTNLLDRTNARESTVRDWCERESIPFLTLTDGLRTAVMDGNQVFYTYDQHWTPDGHQVVAEAVNEFLGRVQAGAGSDTTVHLGDRAGP